MSWLLETAREADIDELMTWFPNAHAVDIWGGPNFRYPFNHDTFYADCRWQEFSSFCLRNADNELAAFGQLGTRYDHSHLARLITNPGMRRQGAGRKLIEMMIDKARTDQGHDKVALFVYKDNQPAYQCYLALGFSVQEYPDGAPMPDKCLYLTRVVNQI